MIYLSSSLEVDELAPLLLATYDLFRQTTYQPTHRLGSFAGLVLHDFHYRIIELADLRNGLRLRYALHVRSPYSLHLTG